jgi:FMN phosphatase YigB (HAD superfamily)
MAIKYRVVLFDFDGVLSRGYFYSGLKKDAPLVYNFIEENVFGSLSGKMDQWMKGQLTWVQINQLIAQETEFDEQKLYEHLVGSIRRMKIEQRLLELSSQLQEKGVKVGLVTDNMDIFNEVTIQHHKLAEFFPVIINSCDYGLLKHEKEGELFEIALEKLQHNSFEEALLIDDSQRIVQVFQNKGGSIYTYINYEQFEPWAQQNLVD